MTNFRFTRNFSEQEKQELAPRIALALTKFSEFGDMTLRIGKVLNGKSAGIADSLSGDYIRLASSDVSMKTIGHELTHLLQGESLGRQIPDGEVQADIWTLARDELFLDAPPNYLVRRIASRVEDQTIHAFIEYQRCKKLGPADISRIAKDISFTGFIQGYFGNRTKQVTENIRENWQDHSKTFREGCQRAIELRDYLPSTYICDLVVNLARYAIKDSIFRQARGIDNDGASRSLVESYKEFMGANPDISILTGMFGNIDKALGLDKIKIKADK